MILTENDSEIEKFYDKLEDFNQECPNCGSTLQLVDDDGVWSCELYDSEDDDKCTYSEFNNITRCHGEGCSQLVLSKKIKYFSKDLQKEVFDYFTDLDDKFCQVPHEPWHDTTCLAIAQHESSEMEREDYEIRQQMKGHPTNCSCYLCLHY